MLSSFFGMEIAKNALQTQQRALDVTGHNIANANTEGYHRQVVNQSATEPLNLMLNGKSQQIGTGVKLADIQRAKNMFLDNLFRSENTKLGYWSGRQDILNNIETLFNDPSDLGINNDLNDFWNSWSELSKDPNSIAARTVLKERAIKLVDSFHTLDAQIQNFRKSIDTDIRLEIKQINQYAQQIAELNTKIATSEASGGTPNDFYDQRDLLLDKLSKYVPVSVVQRLNPTNNTKTFAVVIGDASAVPQQTLIEDGVVHRLQEYDVAQADGINLAGLTFTDSGFQVKLSESGGLIAAQLDIRGGTDNDGYLDKLLASIDKMAAALAIAVNTLHKKGLDLNGNVGEDFFVAENGNITAGTIQLNPSINGSLEKIVANSANPNDNQAGSIAAAISSLAEGWTSLKTVANISAPLDADSFASYYAALVSQAGSDARQAQSMTDLEKAKTDQLAAQRDAVFGVSLDEEMVNMVKYQKSYSAAARIVTVMDDMLDTIIKGMGVTR